MKPIKENLKDEIIHRISLSNEYMSSSDYSEEIKNVFKNENSQYIEFLNLLEIFENRIGFEIFKNSDYTPVKCYKTKEPLKLGDKVKNLKGQCGIMSFDELFNKYFIKTESGKINTQFFIKINKLFDYQIDNTNIECRKLPNKKLW